jgi:hypothetical protein
MTGEALFCTVAPLSRPPFGGHPPPQRGEGGRVSFLERALGKNQSLELEFDSLHWKGRPRIRPLNSSGDERRTAEGSRRPAHAVMVKHAPGLFATSSRALI